MINRAAVILRYKEPAVVWINEADPCDRDGAITLTAANEERTVYLIGDEAADTGATLERWIQQNYRQLFESELEGWCTPIQRCGRRIEASTDSGNGLTSNATRYSWIRSAV